ncbi:MAG: DUF4266 domain-containing protein [Candidatus Krumholzibacteriia bacterium]
MRRRVCAGVGLLIVVTSLALAGCASVGVEAWERDILARPGMQLDPDPMITAFDEHIYFSKEATTGGLAGGGGGCGCN